LTPYKPDDLARPLARSALHLVLGQATTTVLAIVLTGAIGRSLGPSDFGVWYLLTTIAGFAYVFVDWGYAPYIIREVALRPHRAGELTGTVLVIRTATAALVCGPAVITTWIFGYAPRTHALAVLIIASWLPMFLATSCSWTFRGRERMDLEAVVNVVLKIAVLALTLALLALRANLVAVIVAQGFGGVVALGLALRLYQRLSLPPLRVNVPTARELIREAAPMFTMALAISLQPYIDANLLSKLAPAHVVGWYGAAAVFSGTLLAPAIILGGTVYPRLARVTGDPSEFDRLVRTGLRPILFLSMLAAVGTYLFGDVAVSLVYKTATFGPAGAVLRAFAPLLFLASIDIFLGSAIVAAGRMALFATAKVAAVLLTPVLELLLIPLFQTRFGNGGIGIMIALTGGELMLLAVALRLLPARTLDRRALVDLGRAVVSGVGVVLVIAHLPPGSPLVAIPLTIAGYTAFAFALGLVTRSDVDQVRAIVVIRSPRGLDRVGAELALGRQPD
jgi:O-antigen/teichoic acid export membrane protein